MPDVSALREVLARRFDKLEDLGNNILRGERRHDGKPFAVAYIDLSDTIVERGDTLAQFQEELLGSKYFGADSELRWNSYIYLLAGPKSIADGGFAQAKARIERDRHYARKFVVTQDELATRLGMQPIDCPASDSRHDVSAIWASTLRAASLGVLLDQRPRTQALDLIASGGALVAEASAAARASSARTDHLQQGLLRSLSIASFRPINAGRTFHFGDVTLVFGSNGTGKTSLLEAIEALYCGRVRRDPGATFRGIQAQVLTPEGALVSVSSTVDVTVLKARNQSWYGRSDPQSQAISQGFTRFNFLDTDAAFRLSASHDTEQIKSDLSRLLVGPEASKLWTYLTKLEEEARGRVRELEGRLAMLRMQADGLTADLTRARSAPTEANSLARTYRSRIADLGARWQIGDDGASLDLTDRSRLDSLSHCLDQVLATVQVSPVTISAVRARLASLAQALAEARVLADQYLSTVQELEGCDARANTLHAQVQALEVWKKYCESGAPVLIDSRTHVEASIADLRARLVGQPIEAPLELPAEYMAQPPAVALVTARANLLAAEQQEQSATVHLQESERQGLTVAGLRKELHDLAKALMQRTGALSSPEQDSSDLKKPLPGESGRDVAA